MNIHVIERNLYVKGSGCVQVASRCENSYLDGESWETFRQVPGFKSENMTNQHLNIRAEIALEHTDVTYQKNAEA